MRLGNSASNSRIVTSFLRKCDFYINVYIAILGLGNKPKYKEVHSLPSPFPIKSPLRICFYVPHLTPGAEQIIYDIIPTLQKTYKDNQEPVSIAISQQPPETYQDIIFYFKAPRAPFNAKRHILLICDEALQFWWSLHRFDACVCTSSPELSSLLAKKSHDVIFLSEVEPNRLLKAGAKNLSDCKPSNRPRTILWHGGEYSLPPMIRLRPILERIASHSPTKLILISGKQKQLKEHWGPLEVIYRPWSENVLISSAAESRLGLVPTRNLRLGFFKPASRLRRLYALGVPAIGDNNAPEVVRFQARIGAKVATSSGMSWLAYLTELLDDTRIDVLAKKGHELVKQDYSESIAVLNWMKVIHYFTSEPNFFS